MYSVEGLPFCSFVQVLYTGDYSLEDDRLLMAAELPSVRPDVLIVESTFGMQVHTPLKVWRDVKSMAC